AGPFAGMLLADLGAQVIKVELPGRGDDAREFGPFANGVSGYFASVNRGKRSITLNLKSAEGKAIFLRLAEKADVLIENYRPGVMERLGLDYESLRPTNPRLIYAAVSGFGQSGPYSHRPAYDAVIQGMSGLMSITGDEDGLPARVGVSIGDLSAAAFAVIGVLAALHQRDRTGTGQMVDVAMLDSLIALLENAISRYSITGEVPGRLGTRHPSITPFQAFDTADGQVVVAIGNDQLFSSFCRLVGEEQLATDPRFCSNSLRTGNHADLQEEMGAIIRRRPTAWWLEHLEREGIPSGPINTVADMAHDPQVNAREMIQEVMDPVAGLMHMAGIPIKLSDTPGAVVGPAPALGQHTEEVLGELLGLSAEKVAGLRERGVV
ncbi:MAG: CoA transferase, partial [Anaerolineae bacterium]|nr:CoA transferase [Anaerolineae bacterium]